MVEPGEAWMDRKKSMGRFVIQIEQCENATWQGSILWTEKNITQQFRSALEMIKLMDSAVKMQGESEAPGAADK